MAKAKQGAVVSALPVGWIRGADGKYDYDPEVKDAIRAIIDTFFRVRSIRRTLKELTKAGVKIPSREGARLNSAKPTLNNVRRVLINPAYPGLMSSGKQNLNAEDRYRPPANRPASRFLNISG